jgi:hypothetical protein
VRGETVSTRGAWLALAGGPETSPSGIVVTWLGITAFVLFCAGVVAALVGGALGLDVRLLFFVLWGAGAGAYAAAFVTRLLRKGRHSSVGHGDSIGGDADLDSGAHGHGHGHEYGHQGFDDGGADGV